VDRGPGWDRYEVPAPSAPRISEEFLEEERETLPPWVFRQEYECSFEETEDAVFTLDMIERAVTSEVKPLFGAGRRYRGLLRGPGPGPVGGLHRPRRPPERQGARQAGQLQGPSLHLRHLQRYPLRTSYTTIADGVVDVMRSEALNSDEYDPARHQSPARRPSCSWTRPAWAAASPTSSRSGA
jgi:hypothetical protein